MAKDKDEAELDDKATLDGDKDETSEEKPKASAASDSASKEAASSDAPKANSAESTDSATAEPPDSHGSPSSAANGAVSPGDVPAGAEDDEGDEGDEEDDESVAAQPTKTEVAADHGGHDEAPPEDEGPEPDLERDSPKMQFLTTAFVVIAISVIGLVIGAKEYFTSVMEAEIQEKVGVPVSTQLTDLHKQEDARLSKYQWVDQKKGVVRIPADKAQEMVLAHYKSTPIEEPPPPPTMTATPTEGIPTDAPAPTDSAAPADSATPANSAAPTGSVKPADSAAPAPGKPGDGKAPEPPTPPAPKPLKAPAPRNNDPYP